jgi:hypothetical protein
VFVENPKHPSDEQNHRRGKWLSEIILLKQVQGGLRILQTSFFVQGLGKIEVKGYHRPVTVYEIDPFQVKSKNHDPGGTVG